MCLRALCEYPLDSENTVPAWMVAEGSVLGRARPASRPRAGVGVTAIDLGSHAQAGCPGGGLPWVEEQDFVARLGQAVVERLPQPAGGLHADLDGRWPL